MALATMDIGRASGLFSLLAGGFVKAGFSSEPAIVNSCKIRTKKFFGSEYPQGGKTFRVAPFGNRTTPPHPTGRFPHYHRQGPKIMKGNKKGQTVPGQAMKRHRPWDTHSSDKSFWDRF